MWFKYTGFDSKGNPKNGKIEGDDSEDIIAHLRMKGIYGVSLKKIENISEPIEIVKIQRANKNDIKTLPRDEIINMRFNYEALRKMFRSMLLDVGVTEEVLRNLIIDLKSEDVEKQKKVIQFVEDMGFEKEALELSKAFLFKTDFINTENPEDNKNSIDEIGSK